MAVVVEEVGTAKSGRSLRVKLSGSWYGAYMDSGLNDPALKGQSIEAEIATLEKGGPWIKKWTKVAAPQVSQASPPASPPPPAAAAPSSAPTAAPQYAEPVKVEEQNFREACIFMSGAVNHAIASGKVEKPEDIRRWAACALIAFHGAQVDLAQWKSDIPF